MPIQICLIVDHGSCKIKISEGFVEALGEKSAPQRVVAKLKASTQ